MGSNRKERRAQAQVKSTSISIAEETPLAQPSRAPRTHKTLLELAAERQLLDVDGKTIDPSSIINTTINPDGSLSSDSEDVSTDTPYLDVALYTLTLTVLHFTLTFLVNHQYALEPPQAFPLFLSSTVFSPAPTILLLLVAVLHPRASHPLAQVLFGAMSVVAGVWLVTASNEDPYMAVMRKAPALGTLWVWAIVEMRWEGAAGCLGVVGVWGWWMGYTIF